MTIFISHIAFARLVDLVEGRVPESEQAEMIGHLEGCQRCQSELAQLRRLIGIMRSDLSEDAPAQAVARAVRLFRPQEQPAVPNLLRRIVATLSFDSMQLAPALGVRSGTSGARQLLYLSAEHDLDVRIIPANDAWIVAGQLLSTTTGGRAELHSRAGMVETPLSGLSEFEFPPTLAGKYTLLVYLTNELRETEIIEVDSLSIGV